MEEVDLATCEGKRNQYKLDFEKRNVQGEMEQFNTAPWWDLKKKPIAIFIYISIYF